MTFKTLSLAGEMLMPTISIRQRAFSVLRRRPEILARPCPDHVPAGKNVFEKMLEMTLPLAVAIGIWTAVMLPWGVQV